MNNYTTAQAHTLLHNNKVRRGNTEQSEHLLSEERNETERKQEDFFFWPASELN